MRLTLNSHQIEVMSRTLLAVIGGSAFSIFLSLCISFLLPIEKMHAVAWSTMLVFIVFPVVVMWSFSVNNLKKAVSLLSISILFLAAASWLLSILGERI
ncbi:hypothetical protein [Pseudoalteromonas phenolica]|uniref:hypothetical protein n=1 Tax=Pseudoalteromonas phenolica TaxID=161398 RepID=UPI00071769D6|nr:hypothetical protein [Pseudoalteromonas phenolica]RXE98434.1 hypothetical protein D9981_10170 [Pseudoalteromonas phenolica O-BC30]|tara:strand:- start:227 stop:523 length:297 start_codon:yes stop_codon:yes gene_type:complete